MSWRSTPRMRTISNTSSRWDGKSWKGCTRTDYDLSQHQEFSGKDQTYLDPATNERYIPYVVETSAGLTRNVLMALSDAYERNSGGRRNADGSALPPECRSGDGRRASAGEEGRNRRSCKELELSLREEFTTFFDQRSDRAPLSPHG